MSCKQQFKHQKNMKKTPTFSANVKILRWSTPPNWASTFKYSSSKAWNKPMLSSLSVNYAWEWKCLPGYVNGYYMYELIF